jgi:pimeloyl-ACP methyl ester carboxylesterase
MASFGLGVQSGCNMKSRTHISIHALAMLLVMAVETVAAEDVKLAHGGITLNAQLERAGESWPRGPVVLMVHGALAHNRMEMMATFQELFSGAGVSSLAINLGFRVDDRHGFYACESPHAHRHGDAVDEIDLWLAWLVAQGAERVVLLGHSLGGNQAAVFVAERAAPQIAAVVLIAPGTRDAERAASSYEERFGVSLSRRLDEARALVAGGNPDAWLEPTGFLFCADAKVTAEAFLSYYGSDARRDTPSILPDIRKPTIVIAGSEDDVVPGLPARVSPMADGERLRLVVLDGADHFFRDLYAEDAVEIIVEAIAN